MELLGTIVDSGSNWLVGDMSDESTGSFNGKGGTWFTGSEIFTIIFIPKFRCKHECVFDRADSWISGSIINEGFIIKHTTLFEKDTNDYG